MVLSKFEFPVQSSKQLTSTPEDFSGAVFTRVHFQKKKYPAYAILSTHAADLVNANYC